MSEFKRLFTLEEATALIPVVRRIIAELQTRKRQIEDARDRLSGLTTVMRTNGYAREAAELSDQLNSLVVEMRDLLGELEALGVELKDIDAGLVDFPAQRHGRVVYLCWLVSEPEVAFWHDLDAGFRGREPL